MSSAIRHLPFFLAVAEEENFQRAACRLNIVQPALSRRIQQLEHQLGVRLFDRLPRGVRLSEAGRILLNDGRRALEMFEDACASARRVERGEIDTMRLGLTDAALSNEKVTDAVKALRAALPHVDVQIASGVSQDQLRYLRDGETEIAALFLNPSEADDLSSICLAEEDFLLVMRPDDALAEKDRLVPSDLEGRPLIWPKQSSARIYCDRMKAAFDRHDIAPRIEMEVINCEQMESLIDAGLGVGFLNRMKCGNMSRPLVAKPIQDLSIAMNFSLAWRPAEHGSGAQQFRSLLESRYRGQ